MADTGSPWFIPYVEPGDLVRDYPAASEALGTAIAAGLDAAGNAFDASAVITATDASWPVPTLGSPIVKVTVIGGGGGGGAAFSNNGANGGTSTFDAGGAGSISATGGLGGIRGRGGTGQVAGVGFVSSNGGPSASAGVAEEQSGQDGNGGQIEVGYLDLTGVSTVNVTIGAGGAGGAAGGVAGRVGGRGEVIVEYKAG